MQLTHDLVLKSRPQAGVSKDENSRKHSVHEPGGR